MQIFDLGKTWENVGKYAFVHCCTLSLCPLPYFLSRYGVSLVPTEDVDLSVMDHQRASVSALKRREMDIIYALRRVEKRAVDSIAPRRIRQLQHVFARFRDLYRHFLAEGVRQRCTA